MSGAGGVGKTALAARFANIAHGRDGAVVLYGACSEQPANAYQPLTEALSRYVAAASRADLRRQVGTHGPLLARILPLLTTRIPDLQPSPAPEAESQDVASALDAFLANIAAVAPTLLIIDDLQAATSATLSVLRHLTQARGPSSLLVVGIVRAGEDQLSPILAAVGVESHRGSMEHRALDPLDDAQVGELVTAIIGNAPSPEVRRAIVAESAGLPFLVVELARNQMEQTVAHEVAGAIARAEASRLDLRHVRDEIAGGVLQMQRLRAAPTKARGTTLPGHLVEPDGTPPAPGPCPYRGLSHFDGADAEWFFGREQLVAELVARVAGSRFIGVLGASGSGKSSLVRAGLIPALASGALPGSAAWTAAVMTPGAEPFRALFRALAATGRIGPDDARARVERDGFGALAAELVEGAPGARLVVVVDQCEELFTATADDERDRFIDVARSDRRARQPGHRDRGPAR